MQNPKLTEAQKKVIFEGFTEAPFSGKLLHNKKDGDYLCANCNSLLFKSDTKFDSGSGWPSFYEAANDKSIKLKDDNSHGMQRVEVICANCGGHLGHLFPDAPDQPGGMRYCINSCSLNFNDRSKK